MPMCMQWACIIGDPLPRFGRNLSRRNEHEKEQWEEEEKRKKDEVERRVELERTRRK